VNSDDSVRRLKGKKDATRPINGERDRAELLGGLECVDAVVIFGEDTAEPLIRAIKPDVWVKGGEYSMDQLPEAGAVREYGGRIALLSMVEGKSTTAIVNRAREAQKN
jgi:rfaE bifunctional protein nucleotidyltransferase chain/domain